MASRPFSVLFLSSDRAVLRRGSRLLSVFGYQVRAVAAFNRASVLLEADAPDILLADGAMDRDKTLSLIRQGGSASRCIYKVLFAHDMTPPEVAGCLEAGVDDVLERPLEYGELLARLRTAARVLEFERRLADCVAPNKLPLLERPQFLSRVTELITAQGALRPIACIAMQIDDLAAIRTAHGVQPADAIENQLRTVLGQHVTEISAAGRLGEGRLAILAGATAPDASLLIEAIQQGFAACELAPPIERLRPTLSCGISETVRPSSEAEKLVEQSEAGVLLAQSSGGDFVVRFGQFADEDRQWTNLAKNGALFENALARDIMVPCTAVIGTNGTLRQAAALFDQTQLQVLPVVDDEGKLAGILPAGSVAPSAADSPDEPVSTCMTSDMASFDERTSLPALIDYFTQESPLAIVIVHKGRPTGLVTPSSLATLSEQLTTETFSNNAARAGRTGLIVSNLCGVDG